MNWFKPKPKASSQTASSYTPALKVSDYLTPDRIRFFEPGTPVDAALSELVRTLPYARPEAAIAAVLEREKLGSTLLGHGIGMPHARMLDLPDILPAMGLFRSGLQMPSGETLRLILPFIGPVNSMKRNLDFMASVAALFQTETLLDALLKAADAPAVLALIQDAERR